MTPANTSPTTATAKNDRSLIERILRRISHSRTSRRCRPERSEGPVPADAAEQPGPEQVAPEPNERGWVLEAAATGASGSSRRLCGGWDPSESPASASADPARGLRQEPKQPPTPALAASPWAHPSTAGSSSTGGRHRRSGRGPQIVSNPTVWALAPPTWSRSGLHRTHPTRHFVRHGVLMPALTTLERQAHCGSPRIGPHSRSQGQRPVEKSRGPELPEQRSTPRSHAASRNIQRVLGPALVHSNANWRVFPPASVNGG